MFTFVHAPGQVSYPVPVLKASVRVEVTTEAQRRTTGHPLNGT